VTACVSASRTLNEHDFRIPALDSSEMSFLCIASLTASKAFSATRQAVVINRPNVIRGPAELE